MATDPQIGTTIRKRRQVLGMTQEDLAAELRVSKSTVANWESGKHFPLRYLGAIEEVLGISLGEAGPPIPPRLRRMIDELTPGEREWVLAELSGEPSGGGAPGRRNEAG